MYKIQYAHNKTLEKNDYQTNFYHVHATKQIFDLIDNLSDGQIELHDNAKYDTIQNHFGFPQNLFRNSTRVLLLAGNQRCSSHRHKQKVPTAMLTLPRISSGILLASFRTWSKEPPSYRPMERVTNGGLSFTRKSTQKRQGL